jgi:hypothetical protein
MSRRRHVSWVLAAAVMAIALALTMPVLSQGSAPAGGATDYKAPRLAFGHPDLQGVWANNNATPLQRPKSLAGRKFLTEAEVAKLKARAGDLFNGDGDAAFGDEIFEAALSDREKYVADSFDKDTGNYNSFWLVDRDFDNRTSLIVDPEDGRMPAFTKAAEARNAALAAARKAHPADSWEDRPLNERCITFGFPDLLAGYNSYYQIVQTKDYVAIATERIHEIRVIPIDGRPHAARNIRFLHGDPRGRWDGDTLVIETTNFTKAGGGSYLGSATENLRVTERFTRMSPNAVRYEITMDDPNTWTRPWTLMMPLRKSNEKIYEYACHEGNVGLEGILSGHRAQERAAARTPGR